MCKTIDNFPTRLLAAAAVQVQMLSLSEGDHHKILGSIDEKGAAAASRAELKNIIETRRT